MINANAHNTLMTHERAALNLSSFSYALIISKPRRTIITTANKYAAALRKTIKFDNIVFDVRHMIDDTVCELLVMSVFHTNHNAPKNNILQYAIYNNESLAFLRFASLSALVMKSIHT